MYNQKIWKHFQNENEFQTKCIKNENVLFKDLLNFNQYQSVNQTQTQNIDDYILNIRNGLIIKNNEDLYWRLEFISKLCEISLKKDICIEIPETITYDEIGDFIDRIW